MKKCPVCKRFMSETKPCEYCKKSKPEFVTVKSLDIPNKLTVTAEEIDLKVRELDLTINVTADISQFEAICINGITFVRK